jgi:UDP-N-acetylglucosamine:LPS N-acetylglucosamine transferase
MKICLTFSPGGHFSEMRKIMDAFKGHDIIYVTIKAKSTGNLPTIYYLKDTAGPNRVSMFANMVVVAIQSLKILYKEKPDVIISSGADVTIPMCYLGKLFGKKILFIESLCRVNDLSYSGKIVYPIADLFLVQWERLTKKYSKAKYWGTVI